MSNKLNIKEEMRSIDTKDRGWYDSLTEEEKKKVNGVHPTFYKTFLVLAMISFSLGALVNYYTLKKITKK